MTRLVALSLALLLCFEPASANDRSLTISSNNTPLDLAVLTGVANEVFGHLGYRLNLTSLPSERSLRAANDGQVDGEGLRVAGLDQQYPNLIAIPEHFTSLRFVAFAKDASIAIEDWSSLSAHRVAFISGWKIFERNASGAKSVVKVDEAEQMFRMLQSGRIDLALYTEADGQAFLAANDVQDVTLLEPALANVDMYLYLNRSHEDLVGPAAAEIRKMKSDGRYDALIADILSAPVD